MLLVQYLNLEILVTNQIRMSINNKEDELITDLNAIIFQKRKTQRSIRKIKNTTTDYQVVGGTRFRNKWQATDSRQ